MANEMWTEAIGRESAWKGPTQLEGPLFCYPFSLPSSWNAYTKSGAPVAILGQETPMKVLRHSLKVSAQEEAEMKKI